jgi:hypothetical protein
MEDLIKALQIFLKYGNEHYPTACSHDVLWIARIQASDVSEEDKETLEVLGFRVDGEQFYSNRFGAA